MDCHESADADSRNDGRGDSTLQHCDSSNLDSRGLDSSLRTKCYAQNDSLSCHTEHSEVSKTRKSSIPSESKIEKRIDELDSPLRHCVSNDFVSSGLDCFGDKSPRNDGLGDSALQHCDSYNLNSCGLDSSLQATLSAQNDKVLDSHKSPNPKFNHSTTPNPSLTHYIKKFASISGIALLYPKLDDYFIAELFDDNLNQIYDISQANFEKINYEIFSQISQSILNHNVISFSYHSKNITKHRIVKPYKLSHIKGIWYVIADESGILKNFALDKLKDLEILNKRFYPKTAFLAQITQNHNLWHSQSTKTAIIRIDIKAKHYFLRKSLPPNINLIGYDESKILIRFTFAFDDEIFNFLKLWIPYATIKEPKELQNKFNERLKDYINATNTDAGSR